MLQKVLIYGTLFFFLYLDWDFVMYSRQVKFENIIFFTGLSAC